MGGGHQMRKLASIALGMSFWVLASPGVAADRPTYDSLWAEATHNADCKPSDQADFILVRCEGEMTYWYFTKPNHPAHPGVIERVLTQEPDGSWVAKEHGQSFAPDSAQPAFKAWLAQIADLDRQMREEIEKQRSEGK
jgi:hypothetical protein